MMALAGILRIPLFLIINIFYMIVCSIGSLLIRSDRRRRAFLSRITSAGCRITLPLFNIRFTVNNPEKCLLRSGCWLAVSNHVSYLDIIILSSIYRSLYITTVEVTKTFFLGTLAHFSGSLPVERRSRRNLLEETGRIAAVLREGIPVTFFPEGTTSNGETVLPFKGSLFSAAEKARVNVQPVCIRYTHINGRPVSRQNRDLAFYYGSLSFFPHLMRLFFVRSIRGTVTFLDPVTIAGKERKTIVADTYAAILNAFHSSCPNSPP